jgi:hypothetical protein
MNTLLHTQKGYIGLTVVAFMLMLSLIIYPWKVPLNKEIVDCRVGTAVEPGSGESVMLPPIINLGMSRMGHKGGWDESAAPVEYVPIRKNVPIFTKSNDPNYVMGYPDWMGRPGPLPPQIVKWPIIASEEVLGRHADTRHTLKYDKANQPGFEVYFPNETGEVELVAPATLRTGEYSKILTLRTEGFLFFVHLGPDGKPIQMNYGQHIYLLVDMYQDKTMFETPDNVKGYNTDDLFHCIDPDSPMNGSVISPEQDKSPGKDQLQLEWFIFSGQAGMYAHCKPAVYLYPRQQQLVNIKVYPQGELGYTDPFYDKTKGWTVTAFPDGKLINNNNSSPIRAGYLYYESKLLDNVLEKPEKGWVVRGQESGEMEELFNDILPKLGLNAKEKQDFEEYWLKTLPESQYYFVGLIDKNQRDYLERLEVIPTPDTSIRFSLFFEPLEEPKIVKQPEIITPRRKGFTLVDWGGMIKLHKDTPFTCSQ